MKACEGDRTICVNSQCQKETKLHPCFESLASYFDTYDSIQFYFVNIKTTLFSCRIFLFEILNENVVFINTS